MELTGYRTEKAENLQLPQANGTNAGHDDPYKAETSGSFSLRATILHVTDKYDLNLSRVRN